MTNQPYEPGLVSAYLDGELTAEERAAFEVRLHSSPELQRELAELQSLGKLLSGLPWHRLDENFAHEVDVRCDDLRPFAADNDVCRVDNPAALTNESGTNSLDAITITASGANALQTPRRQSSLLRMLATPGLVAAGLIAAVLFWQSRLEPPREIVATRETPVTLPEDYLQRTQQVSADTSQSPEEIDESESPRPKPVVTAAPQPIAANTADDTRRRLKPKSHDRAGSRALNIKRIAPEAEFGAVEKPAMGLETAKSAGLEFRRDLRSLQIGDIVEAIDHDGDGVRVVQLTVVDRVQGLRDLQVLLARHNIRAETARVGKPAELAGPAVMPGENKQSADDSPQNTSDTQLLAVYVEADAAQLQAALSQLIQDQQFAEIHSETTTLAQADLSRWLTTDGQRELAPQADKNAANKPESQLAAAGMGSSAPFRRQDGPTQDLQAGNKQKRFVSPAPPGSPAAPAAVAPDSVVAAATEPTAKSPTIPRKFSGSPANDAGRVETRPKSVVPGNPSPTGASLIVRNGQADSQNANRDPGNIPQEPQQPQPNAATARAGRQTVVSVPAEFLANLKKTGAPRDSHGRNAKKSEKGNDKADALRTADGTAEPTAALRSKSARVPVLIVFVAPAKSPAVPSATPPR